MTPPSITWATTIIPFDTGAEAWGLVVDEATLGGDGQIKLHIYQASSLRGYCGIWPLHPAAIGFGTGDPSRFIEYGSPTGKWVYAYNDEEGSESYPYPDP